jgi:GAF domain-containing protein
MLTALLLLPAGRREAATVLVERTATPRAAEAVRAETPVVSESESSTRSAPIETETQVAASDAPAAEPVAAPSEPEPIIVPAPVVEVTAATPTIAPIVTTTDFPRLASLCVDLARVSDTRALPSLLDRAASVLDASGIILWIADPDGRELNPIFAQGYPQQLINRLGTIPRDAENATAAAFRTSLLQTVKADHISPGAIAAPLVTSGGCVGVMAAEVLHDSERQEAMLAAATIVAAQLATLVGPPSARSHATKTG